MADESTPKETIIRATIGGSALPDGAAGKPLGGSILKGGVSVQHRIEAHTIIIGAVNATAIAPAHNAPVTLHQDAAGFTLSGGPDRLPKISAEARATLVIDPFKTANTVGSFVVVAPTGGVRRDVPIATGQVANAKAEIMSNVRSANTARDGAVSELETQQAQLAKAPPVLRAHFAPQMAAITDKITQLEALPIPTIATTDATLAAANVQQKVQPFAGLGILGGQRFNLGALQGEVTAGAGGEISNHGTAATGQVTASIGKYLAGLPTMLAVPNGQTSVILGETQPGAFKLEAGLKQTIGYNPEISGASANYRRDEVFANAHLAVSSSVIIGVGGAVTTNPSSGFALPGVTGTTKSGTKQEYSAHVSLTARF